MTVPPLQVGPARLPAVGASGDARLLMMGWDVYCDVCRRTFEITGETEAEAREKFVRYHVHVGAQAPKPEGAPTDRSGR